MPPPSTIPSKPSPSPYLEKLASAPPNWLLDIPVTPPQPWPYAPTYYFFYGTLSKPDTLKHILELPTSPTLRTAQIEGYSLAMWGQYRALVNGPQGNVVAGSAFLVPTKEDAPRLAYYETNAYEVAPCMMTFTDDQEPHTALGKTFMYAGDAEALLAGKFDRKLWQKQMGMGLPKMWDRKSAEKS